MTQAELEAFLAVVRCGTVSRRGAAAVHHAAGPQPAAGRAGRGIGVSTIAARPGPPQRGADRTGTGLCFSGGKVADHLAGGQRPEKTQWHCYTAAGVHCQREHLPAWPGAAALFAASAGCTGAVSHLAPPALDTTMWGWVWWIWPSSRTGCTIHG